MRRAFITLFALALLLSSQTAVSVCVLRCGLCNTGMKMEGMSMAGSMSMAGMERLAGKQLSETEQSSVRESCGARRCIHHNFVYVLPHLDQLDAPIVSWTAPPLRVSVTSTLDLNASANFLREDA